MRRIKKIEAQIDQALGTFELHQEIEKALEIYTEAESQLTMLPIKPDHAAYTEQQRVVSYCLMRKGNILRQLGKHGEALAVSEQELAAARASEDEITLARSLMSNGTDPTSCAEIWKKV
jgi:hypothetical protein